MTWALLWKEFESLEKEMIEFLGEEEISKIHLRYSDEGDRELLCREKTYSNSESD